MTFDRRSPPVRAKRARICQSWWFAPAVVVLIALAAMIVLKQPFSPTDAYVYWAAGERLNAGHELYSLQPGDIVIAPNPPYWTVPLLSPPLVGVLWRPFAALGTSGMLLGWLLTALAFLAALAATARHAPAATIAAVALLVAPVAGQLMLGNVNGLLALGLVGVWKLRDRPVLCGTLVAVMASLKVTPIILAVWLLATGRRRAFTWCVAAALTLLVVAAIGAGAGSLGQYLGVIVHTTVSGSSDLSVAGLLRSIGLPAAIAALAPWAIVVGGFGAIVVFWRRPAVSFAIAVIVLVVGSPVVQSYWYALPVVVLIAAPDPDVGSLFPRGRTARVPG